MKVWRWRPVAVPQINSFTGEYRFLSNFWPAQVVLDGEVYPSVECAYQASKTPDKRLRERMRVSSAVAKRLGKSLCPLSVQERLEYMRDLVSQKFSVEPLRSKLLATGDSELVEGNWWGDRFWGVSAGRGENHLGKILIEVREKLRLGA